MLTFPPLALKINWCALRVAVEVTSISLAGIVKLEFIAVILVTLEELLTHFDQVYPVAVVAFKLILVP